MHSPQQKNDTYERNFSGCDATGLDRLKWWWLMSCRPPHDLSLKRISGRLLASLATYCPPIMEYTISPRFGMFPRIDLRVSSRAAGLVTGSLSDSYPDIKSFVSTIIVNHHSQQNSHNSQSNNVSVKPTPTTHPMPSDSSITYENPFQNTIFNDQTSSNMATRDLSEPVYQQFTATGRPLRASMHNTSALAGGFAAVESFGSAAPNHLPVRFTDNSIISVPVLPHAAPTRSKLEYNDSASSIYSDDTGPIKEDPKSKSRFSLGGFRRKSSSSGHSNQAFIIKKMKRSDYLKYYAKDNDSKYIGTEDPAPDCILSNAQDKIKYRRA